MMMTAAEGFSKLNLKLSRKGSHRDSHSECDNLKLALSSIIQRSDEQVANSISRRGANPSKTSISKQP